MSGAMSGRRPLRLRSVFLAGLVVVAAGCSILPGRHHRTPFAPADSLASQASVSDSTRSRAADSSDLSQAITATGGASERTAGSPGNDRTGTPLAGDPPPSERVIQAPVTPDTAPSAPVVSVELSEAERVALIRAYSRDVRAADSLATELGAPVRGQAGGDLIAIRNLIAMAGEAYDGRDYAAAANLSRKARLLAEDAFKARRGSR